MASPKLSRGSMMSPPIANSARFRSPGIVRRVITGDSGYQSAQFAKKARRSKSSEANSRNVASNLLAGKRKLSRQDDGSAEQHLELLNNRWRLMAKNQEKMTKEEIMNNYKLLLTDHIKLEKFMSLISRENELNRTRLESDLLDSMMVVEELKQTLAARDLSKRSRIDPRESEERRELMKQNKKLLHELHESSKKVDKLELAVFELQEQVELKDFQMMEAQNQKIIIEEQLEHKKDSVSQGFQTIESPMNDNNKLKMELDNVKSDFESIKTEYDFLSAEVDALKDDNDVLKISEENLQEEILVKVNEITGLKHEIEQLEDRLKNPDDCPGSVRGQNVYVCGPTERHVNHNNNDDEDTLRSMMSDELSTYFNDDDEDEDDDVNINTTTDDSGMDLLSNSSRVMNSGNQKSDANSPKLELLQDTVKLLMNMLKENDMGNPKPIEAENLKNISKFNFSADKSSKPDGQYSIDRYSPVGACCSNAYKVTQLETENRRWKSFVENIGKSDNELLNVIADLEETVRTTKTELDLMRKSRSVNNSPFKTSNKNDRSAEYFSRRLEEIQIDHSDEQINLLLAAAEESKADALSRCVRLEEELDTCNRYIEKLDSELTGEKKIELTLRRRIETLEQRLMMGMPTGNAGMSGHMNKSMTEMETKIVQLETINSSLIEVNSVEKRRMEEQKSKMKDLELANKGLNEKLNLLRTKEICAQNKINRLQAVYEDLLREYAAVKIPSTKSSDNDNHKFDSLPKIIEENNKLKQQVNNLKTKVNNLQSLIVRYQEYLVMEPAKSGKLNHNIKSLTRTQFRDLKINEINKK